jgi:uncharacterized membrane protein HdeD (DUF308 family)
VGIITGVAEIGAAIRLRRHITGEWLLGLAGALSILFGVLMVATPLLGAVIIAVWFGAYAFMFGLVLLFLGLRLRRWGRDVPHAPLPMPAG